MPLWGASGLAGGKLQRAAAVQGGGVEWEVAGWLVGVVAGWFGGRERLGEGSVVSGEWWAQAIHG
jgi:hypothetical protein